MSAIPLPVPMRDPTQREAVAVADRGSVRRLEVSIEERCGEQLLAAFLRLANAWFTGRDAVR